MPLESLFSNEVSAMAGDMVAPAQVTGLAFTVAQGQVNLTWNAVTTNADASAITDLGGYRIYRKNDAATEWQMIGSVGAGETSYQDTSMLDGASYIYAVSAVDDEATPNEGAKSEDLAVKTIPSVPQNLVATAGDSLINLTWDSVLDGAQPKKNENLAGYKVYRSTVSGSGYVEIGQTAADITTFEDSTAVNGTEYFYVVTAIDNTP